MNLSKEIQEAINNLMAVLYKEGKDLEELKISGHTFKLKPVEESGT